ncbi:hypothetical protein [Paenibacillus harenae]|uniref:hypothetical protein n=1 Tax=Paenibacillus harenae TaxID=306543 RepID=UPI0003FAA0CC|nr:hypothetical protein [Paenibacillus harenae]
METKRLETFMDDFFQRLDVTPFYTGAGVVVVQDGEVRLQKGYGYMDTSQQTPIEPDAEHISPDFAERAAQFSEREDLEIEMTSLLSNL